MVSSRFAQLVSQNKSTWKFGLAIVAAGATFKVVYFNFSRGLMVDHMDQRHVQATEHLVKARDFGYKKAMEREKAEKSVPKLTPAQKQQLDEYLQLMREAQPDVYPKESKRWE